MHLVYPHYLMRLLLTRRLRTQIIEITQEIILQEVEVRTRRVEGTVSDLLASGSSCFSKVLCFSRVLCLSILLCLF